MGTAAFYKAKSYFYNNDQDADGYDVTQDCDDDNPNVYPGATELCDGIDNNCNQQSDEGLVFSIYYPDTDNDGFGDINAPLNSCLASAPVGFVTNSMDCLDNNATVYAVSYTHLSKTHSINPLRLQQHERSDYPYH